MSSFDHLRLKNNVAKEQSPILKKISIAVLVVASVGVSLLVGTMGGGRHDIKSESRQEASTIKDLHDLKYSMQAINSADISDNNVVADDDQELNRRAEAQVKIKMVKQNAPSSIYHQAPSFSKIKESASSDPATQTFNADGSSYAKFGNQAYTPGVIKATRGANPNTTVMSGEFIHATLETRINSDLPGMVRAVVSRPVYAYVGHKILIPRGSRVIGQYSSQTRQGINRVFVIWNRVILPNGNSALISSPSSSGLGEAGLGADDYNTHFMKRFSMAGLLSVIGAGTATVGVDQNQAGFNSAAAYRMAVANSFNNAAQSSLAEASTIKPTITVYQGDEINIFVAHDIDFSGVL